MTAYAVGRALGRATANVYKAVQSLAGRGAVLIEEGEQRVCRAVPLNELLRQLEAGFRSHVENAKAALTQIQAPPSDERVYKVESSARVFERCREMLARAEKVAVIDAFPASLERIRPLITAACKRGVQTLVEAYAPVSIDGATVAVFPRGDKTLDSWRSEQLNIVIDGREHLLALLSADLETVYQAVWSNSLYLSCIHHAGRVSEHTLIAMLAANIDQQPSEALALLRRHRFMFDGQVLGQQELVERFAPKKPAGHQKRKK